MDRTVHNHQNVYEAHRLSHWATLLDAQNYIRLGKVTEAIKIYERAMRKNFHILYTDQSSDSGWIIEKSPLTPSLNWAGVFLIEYFIQLKVWREWFGIITPLLDRIDKLPLVSQSRLISGMGWANQKTSSTRTLRKEIDIQLEMLNKLGDDMSFEAGLHYMVLGRSYQQLRDHQQSMRYLDLASAKIDFESEPYYAILLSESFSSTYYFLNEFGKDYYKQAELISRDVEKKALHCNQGIDFTLQAYNLGWIYVEQGLFNEALLEFRRGYEDTEQQLTDYDTALYAYGLGYTYLRQKRYEDATSYLENALFVFNNKSYLMSAICLGLIAKILQEESDYNLAIERALDALSNINKIDNPVQSYHIYRRIFILYRVISPVRAIYFGIVTYLYKIRLRKSLLRI